MSGLESSKGTLGFYSQGILDKIIYSLRFGSQRQIYIKWGSVPLKCNTCGVHAMKMLKITVT